MFLNLVIMAAFNSAMKEYRMITSTIDRLRPTHVLSCCVAVFVLLQSGASLAQAPQSGPWAYSFDIAGLHQSETGLKDSEGDFALDRWFASAGLDYAWNRRNSLGVSVGYGRSEYEFSEDSTFGGGSPWNRINEGRVSLTGRFGLGQRGTLFVIPSLRHHGASGASSSDSRTYGLIAAAAWRMDEKLTIGPGFGMISKLEGGARVFPLLAIDWDITERWNLSTGGGLAASQGPGLTLSYRLNSAWSFGLAGRYEKIEFRLNESGAAPGGIGQDESFPLVLSARLETGPKLSATVFTGVELGGKLRLKDALEVTVDESKYDPAAIFGALLTLSF
jgi:hypothetical protein